MSIKASGWNYHINIDFGQILLQSSDPNTSRLQTNRAQQGGHFQIGTPETDMGEVDWSYLICNPSLSGHIFFKNEEFFFFFQEWLVPGTSMCCRLAGSRNSPHVLSLTCRDQAPLFQFSMLALPTPKLQTIRGDIGLGVFTLLCTPEIFWQISSKLYCVLGLHPFKISEAKYFMVLYPCFSRWILEQSLHLHKRSLL